MGAIVNVDLTEQVFFRKRKATLERKLSDVS